MRQLLRVSALLLGVLALHVSADPCWQHHGVMPPNGRLCFVVEKEMHGNDPTVYFGRSAPDLSPGDNEVKHFCAYNARSTVVRDYEYFWLDAKHGELLAKIQPEDVIGLVKGAPDDKWSLPLGEFIHLFGYCSAEGDSAQSKSVHEQIEQN